MWSRPTSLQVWSSRSLTSSTTFAVDLHCTAALTGKLFQIYPRHRWVGADATVDQVALCEVVHGLASQTFQHLYAANARLTAQPMEAHATGLADGSSLYSADTEKGRGEEEALAEASKSGFVQPHASELDDPLLEDPGAGTHKEGSWEDSEEREEPTPGS